jgi:hypothetical protein
MIPSGSYFVVFHLIFLLITRLVNSQSLSTASDFGYIGYSLDASGDPDSAVYETAATSANVSTTIPPPDVFLNASVSVGELDIFVSNLTAKINVDAEVLNLLSFNAGVSAHIDRVSLVIQQVKAKVVLEARLENLVLMINDVLQSLDLNPVLATLGQDIGNVVNSTVGGLTTNGTAAAGTIVPRSYNLDHNILYSINDYSGHTHTNRILEQDGSIVDLFLDNNGHTTGQQVVGYYARDMTFTGYNQSVVRNGQTDRELQYVYNPFLGLTVISAIFLDPTGTVIAAQVLSESGAGGSSTVGEDP